jgi:hypothetical protein
MGIIRTENRAQVRPLLIHTQWPLFLSLVWCVSHHMSWKFNVNVFFRIPSFPLWDSKNSISRWILVESSFGHFEEAVCSVFDCDAWLQVSNLRFSDFCTWFFQGTKSNDAGGLFLSGWLEWLFGDTRYGVCDLWLELLERVLPQRNGCTARVIRFWEII